MTVVNPGGGGTSSINFSVGSAAAKPAAPATNKDSYWAQDTNEVWFANAAGNAWVPLGQTSNTNGWKLAGGNVTLSSTVGPQLAFINGQIAIQGAQLLSSNLIDITAAGQGLNVKEGANSKQGLSAAMVAGTVTVANTSVTANSRIFLTRAPGGANPGACSVSAIVAATSFTITSTNAGDTGQVFFEIFEPG